MIIKDGISDILSVKFNSNDLQHIYCKSKTNDPNILVWSKKVTPTISSIGYMPKTISHISGNREWFLWKRDNSALRGITAEHPGNTNILQYPIINAKGNATFSLYIGQSLSKGCRIMIKEHNGDGSYIPGYTFDYYPENLIRTMYFDLYNSNTNVSFGRYFSDEEQYTVTWSENNESIIFTINYEWCMHDFTIYPFI